MSYVGVNPTIPGGTTILDGTTNIACDGVGNKITFDTNGSEVMRILSTGLIGVNMIPSGSKLEITIDDGNNVSGLGIFQNDVTNNQNALNIVNLGTGDGLFINQDGNGISINIDTETTTTSGIQVVADALTTGQGINVYSNSASYTGTNGILSAKLDNVSSTGTLMKLINDGTGVSLFVDSNNTSSTPAVDVDHAATASACLRITAENASYTSNALQVEATRAANTAFNIQSWYASGTSDLIYKFRGDGTATADVSFTGGGADFGICLEWLDGNPNNEDRRGWSVVLENGKIRRASEGEDAFGVISAISSYVDNASPMKWDRKYLKDEFYEYIEEEYTHYSWTDEDGTEHSYVYLPAGVIPPENAIATTHDEEGNPLKRRVLNPDYDPTVKYVPRSERKEWDVVARLGPVPMLKGEVTGSRWVKMDDISDITEWWMIQ